LAPLAERRPSQARILIAAVTTITGGDLVVGISSLTTGSGAATSITSGATGTGLLTVNGGWVDLSTFNLAVAGFKRLGRNHRQQQQVALPAR